MNIQATVSSCSKGARGLSVFPRVGGIFTSTTISLDPWLRQLPSRYAIHAGRYLTDKEFRYLRTVIVTAAVYSGFNQMLRLRWHHQLTFEHRAGVTPYTSTYVLAKCCVLVNSREGLFVATSIAFESKSLYNSRHTLYRRYGASLQSSLTRVLPRALEYSSHPPVSVYGTGNK